jgi:hypothetical protein
MFSMSAKVESPPAALHNAIYISGREFDVTATYRSAGLSHAADVALGGLKRVNAQDDQGCPHSGIDTLSISIAKNVRCAMYRLRRNLVTVPISEWVAVRSLALLRNLHFQQSRTQRLAVCIHRQRCGDAGEQRLFADELQRE